MVVTGNFTKTDTIYFYILLRLSLGFTGARGRERFSAYESLGVKTWTSLPLHSCCLSDEANDRWHEKVEIMPSLWEQSVLGFTNEFYSENQLQRIQINCEFLVTTHYFRAGGDVATQIQASNGNSLIEVLFVCKSVLRGNAESDLQRSRRKTFWKKEQLRSDLWRRSSRCEILDVSAHIPALARSFAGGEPEAATDLVTSEVTHHSFRATWTPPGSPVDQYRVTYMTAAGGPTQEVRPPLLLHLVLW